MHFWIDKRATPFQYGRRRPNFYSSGTFASSAFGRERDKTFRGTENHLAFRPPPSSLSPGPSSSFYGNTLTAPTDSPPHRFQIPLVGGNSREYPHPQLSPRITGGGDVGSPYNARRSRSAGSSSNQYVTRTRSRSQSRERRAGGISRSERRRRSSSNSRRQQGSISGPNASTDVAVRAALNELQQLRTNSSFSSSEADKTRRTNKKTKRIGLTLCFMGVIVLFTVAVNFLIKGPTVIDTTRQGTNRETAVYFFFTELVCLAFAMALFFAGVACLRKRTNAYLLRQFNQHIASSRSGSRSTPIHSDDVFLDGPDDEESGDTLVTASEQSPFTNLHQHPEGLSPISSPTHNCVFHSALINSSSGRRGHHLISLPLDSRPPRRCPHFHNSAAALLQKQQPPPYNVALYLPPPNRDHYTDPVSIHSHETSQHWSILNSCNEDFKMDEAEKERQENDLVAIAISQSGDREPNPETPPPTYEEFTFQI